MNARSIIVTGRVQGVGYRWFVQRQAKAIGLTGWVRNLPDGSVEVRAEGSRNALDSLELLLKDGPPGSHVSNLQSSSIWPSGRFTDFDISY